MSAVLRKTVLAVLRTTKSACFDNCATAASISAVVASGNLRARGLFASRTRNARRYASCFGPEVSFGGTSAAGSRAYAIRQ